MGKGTQRVEWVKGHSGVEGNERADERAKEGVRKGVWRSDPSLATPAGIRQAYQLFQKCKHIKWDRDEVRGLTYLHTDKGPMRYWLHKIGRADHPRCGCGKRRTLHTYSPRGAWKAREGVGKRYGKIGRSAGQ